MGPSQPEYQQSHGPTLMEGGTIHANPLGMQGAAGPCRMTLPDRFLILVVGLPTNERMLRIASRVARHFHKDESVSHASFANALSVHRLSTNPLRHAAIHHPESSSNSSGGLLAL